MKNSRYILLTLILLMIYMPRVNAGACNKSDMLRVKGEANEVKIDYELRKDEVIKDLFDIKITGLADDLYIKEETTGMLYTNEIAVDNVITLEGIKGDNLIFKIYYWKCDDALIRTIKYPLPKYNHYSELEECDKISEKELEICDPWYQGELNEEIFEKKMKEYKDSLKEEGKTQKKEHKVFNQIKNFLVNYYIYIIAVVAVILVTTIIVIVNKKRGSLE